MIEKEDINKRLGLFIGYKKLTISKIETLSKIGRNSLNNAINGTGGIGVDKVANILSTFPELNANWLLTGEGEMLLEETKPIAKFIPLENKPVVYLSKTKATEILDLDAVAGLTGFDGDEDDLEKVVKFLPQFSFRIQIVVRIKGDSMQPILQDGQQVMATPVMHDEVVHGKIYLVNTVEYGVLIKRVLINRETEQFILFSQNTFKYPDAKFLASNEIISFFRVLAIVDFIEQDLA